MKPIAPVARDALTAGLALGALATMRLWHRRGAATVVVVGVAAGAFALLGAGVAANDARDRALREGIENAPAEQRGIRATVFETRVDANDPDALDKQSGAGPPPGERPRDTARALPAAGFRREVVRGVVVAAAPRFGSRSERRLVAVDDPRSWMTLIAGRAPSTPCERRRCEAVYLGGGRASGARLRIAGVTLVVVGRARLDPAPVGRIPPARGDLGSGAAHYLVLGVSELAELPELAGRSRKYSWLRELDPAAVHPWNTGSVLTEIGAARARLVTGSQANVVAPVDLLTALQDRGRVTSARILLIAGQAAGLLLCFAAFAAAQRRRDVAYELERLRDLGATRPALACFALLEALAVGVLGVILAVGAVAVCAVATGAGTAFARSLLALDGALLIAAILVGAIAAQVAGIRAQPSRRTRGTAEAVVGVMLALVLWQAATRGALDADLLIRGGGLDPAVLLLPTLVGAAGALLALRTLPLVFGALERLTRRASAGLRLHALGLARNAGITGATVAMVALGAAAGLFALGYRHDLRAGMSEQAAYATGADVRVSERPAAGEREADVLPFDRYSAVAPHARAWPVIRLRASRLDAARRATGNIQLLGVPAELLPRLAGWRPDFSSLSSQALARALGPPRPLALAGPRLPAGATRVRLPIRVHGVPVTLTLVVQTSAGRLLNLTLATAVTGRLTPSLPIPRAARAGRVVSLRVTVVGASSNSDVGAVVLGTLRSGNRAITSFTKGWSAVGREPHEVVDGRARFSYPSFATGRTFSFSHDQPHANEPLPALVSPELGGELTLAVAGDQVMRVKAVGSGTHFPTVGAGASFAVVDAGRLFAAVNRLVPNAALPSEAWLDLGEGAAASSVVERLRRPPFRARALVSRASSEEDLERDALARTTLFALAATALIGIATAVIALLLAVVAALRDEAGELGELEALGIAPNRLRRLVRARAATIALLGALPALLTSVVLGHIIVAVTQIAADGRTPLPPLRVNPQWAVAGLVLVIAAAGAGIGIVTITSRALRGDRLGRLHG